MRKDRINILNHEPIIPFLPIEAQRKSYLDMLYDLDFKGITVYNKSNDFCPMFAREEIMVKLDFMCL